MKKKYNKQRLKHVIIKGYKSIAYDFPVILELKDVSILLGANGAGKSNIVSFFEMLSYMMSRKFATYVEMAGTSNSILHYGSKRTPVLSGELEFSDSYSTDTYSFNLANAAPDRLILTDERVCWQQDGKEKPYEVQLELNYKESSLAESKDKVAHSIYNMLSFCKVYQFHDSSLQGPLRQACPIETADYLQSKGNNLPSFLFFLKNNYIDAYNRILGYVREVVPQFDDFYLQPYNDCISLKWKDSTANDYVFNSCQLSDGSIRFIALATLLLQPEETMPNVIILDEPELGLHPFAVTQLAEMIKDASLHTQVIVATQSKDLVDHFDVDNISIVEMDNGHTMVKNLRRKDYEEWLKQYTISELWDKNVIGGRPL